MVSLKLRPKSFRELLNRRLGGPSASIGVLEKRRNVLSLPGFESRVVSPVYLNYHEIMT